VAIATHVEHVDLADSAALWTLALASPARMGAVIRAQPEKTQGAVWAALDRRGKAHARRPGCASLWRSGSAPAGGPSRSPAA
jgi:hypothetical protein